jgi:hypothetical protein
LELQILLVVLATGSEFPFPVARPTLHVGWEDTPRVAIEAERIDRLGEVRLVLRDQREERHHGLRIVTCDDLAVVQVAHVVLDEPVVFLCKQQMGTEFVDLRSNRRNRLVEVLSSALAARLATFFLVATPTCLRTRF